MEQKELKIVERLSPTSINNYFRCPRVFYYDKIEKIRVKPNIYLIRGSIVHGTLEYFFKYYKTDLKGNMKKLFVKQWEKYNKSLKNLELSKKELVKEKRIIHTILTGYYNQLKYKIDALIQSEKAENERMAFYLLRPKMRELWVEDTELHCGGYIDRIHKDFNGFITLGDYKTSSKYGIGMPENYKRQLAIYALLYKNQTNETPNFVSVIFLRYGEEIILEVTPSLLKYARDTIQYVWSRTRSTDIKNYPPHEGNLCGWCQFQPLCSKEKEFKDKGRKEILKKLLK